MQNDEVIWQVIRHNHCSFMAKIETGNFCRNPYNVTGICNRSSCPLANSRYVTIRDHDGNREFCELENFYWLSGVKPDAVIKKICRLPHRTPNVGVFYLYMKTIERAHMPNKLWERVKLPRNYEKAMEIIDKHLMYWPKFLIHKTKQRLTKMTQMRIRMRKLALKIREKVMTAPTKIRKREARREEKALVAAKLETSIEKEVLERLKKGTYGEIYNVPQREFEKILDFERQVEDNEYEEEEEAELEYVEGYDELEEDMDDLEDFGGPAYDESLKDEDDEDDDDDDDEDLYRKKSRASEKETTKLKKKKGKVTVEVEYEGGGEGQKALH